MSHKKLLRLIICAMWGALMFGSTFVLKAFPNIHLLALFIIVLTRVYGGYALIPIYIYVFLEGVIQGFSPWWLPYLYIWTVLWGMTMLLPRNIPEKWKPLAYMLVCAAHGYLYGTLYAPAQALLFGLDFKGMIAWIMAGLPFDFVHGTSNLLCGMLIYPLAKLLERMEKHSVA